MILLISVVSEQPAHWLNSVRRFPPLPAPPLHLHPCLSPWLSRHIHSYIRASKGTLILGIWDLKYGLSFQGLLSLINPNVGRCRLYKQEAIHSS